MSFALQWILLFHLPSKKQTWMKNETEIKKDKSYCWHTAIYRLYWKEWESKENQTFIMVNACNVHMVRELLGNPCRLYCMYTGQCTHGQGNDTIHMFIVVQSHTVLVHRFPEKKIDTALLAMRRRSNCTSILNQMSVTRYTYTNLGSSDDKFY